MQVAGIVGRAELMSALCFFLTILCYGRACDDEPSWWKGASWLVLVVLFMGCALLFKEQGITAVVCNRLERKGEEPRPLLVVEKVFA